MGQADQRSEERTRALVRARLRGSGLDRDANILDLSSRGLLLTAAMPPKRDHTVTVVANGYTLSGKVVWVNERRFGISLDAPILVDDVIDAKILARAKTVSPGLPENFGARPVAASASLGFSDYIQSKWVRYALLAVVAIVGVNYLIREVGEVFSGMGGDLANMQAMSSAESDALKAQ